MMDWRRQSVKRHNLACSVAIVCVALCYGFLAWRTTPLSARETGEAPTSTHQPNFYTTETHAQFDQLRNLTPGMRIFGAQYEPPPLTPIPQGETRMMTASVTSNADPMCRFGYSVVSRAINAYNQNEIAGLRAGWYSNFGVHASPVVPTGMEFVQTVRLHQKKTTPAYNAPYVVPYTYTVSPNLPDIVAIAAASPGQLWIIGNEIERVDWDCGGGVTCGQDEMTPVAYVQAYHEIYQAIKTADPTAQVAIGGVIQITPLRLKYLDLIWDIYRSRYGGPMPVDVWNMHPYILQEVRNSWGADIPAGLTEPVGIVYAIDDNDNLNIFRQQIVMMRQWMKNKGQQDKPLIISEFGINFPTSFGFSLSRVRNYMYGAFDYMLTATDSNLGYPADDYRLVQRWNWFSLDHDAQYYNGALFNYATSTIDQLGLDWTAYVNDANKPLGPALNLKMLPVNYTVDMPDVSGLSTATVYLQISHSGYRNLTGAIPVKLSYSSGSVITETAISGLQGCGSFKTIAIQMTNLPQGVYALQAQVDPLQMLPDENLMDNQQNFSLLVPTQRTFLPLAFR